jgi:hypothetical protein
MLVVPFIASLLLPGSVQVQGAEVQKDATTFTGTVTSSNALRGLPAEESGRCSVLLKEYEGSVFTMPAGSAGCSKVRDGLRVKLKCQYSSSFGYALGDSDVLDLLSGRQPKMQERRIYHVLSFDILK